MFHFDFQTKRKFLGLKTPPFFDKKRRFIGFSKVSELLNRMEFAELKSDFEKFRGNFGGEFDFNDVFGCYFYELEKIPVCKICDVSLTMKRGLSRGFGKYCSSICQGRDDDFFKRRTETVTERLLEKFGVDNVMKVREYKERQKNTVIERYGVDNVAKAERFKLKSKIACLEKYGTVSSLGNYGIREKAKKTLLEKYGVDNAI